MLVRDARAPGCGGDGAMVNSGEGRIWTWKYGSQTDVGVAAGLKYDPPSKKDASLMLVIMAH